MDSLLFSPRNRTLRRTLTPDTGESTCAAVCRAVSDVLDEPILELPPLGTVVDPDVVEAVGSAQRTTGHVAFEYSGLVVVVSTDGKIAVYDDE